MLGKRIRALITCEVTEDFLSALKARNIEIQLSGWGQSGHVLGEKELIEKARDCEIVIIEIEELSASVIEALPNLCFIGVSRGAPVNVDLDYCKQRGISVVHTPGRNADSVADYCLSMMLDLSRKITASSRHLSSEGWMFEGKLPYLQFRGRELGKLKIGLFGYGQIGARVAQRLHMGFGAQVYFFDPFVDSSLHANKVKSLEELFELSDIVSLHAPVVPETENTVNGRLLKLLGRDGILISSARAKLIVEEDLYNALATGSLGAAAIDVFWTEPINSENKWLKLPNVICTPHIAGASLDVVTNHCETILKGLDEWLIKEKTKRGLA